MKQTQIGKTSKLDWADLHSSSAKSAKTSLDWFTLDWSERLEIGLGRLFQGTSNLLQIGPNSILFSCIWFQVVKSECNPSDPFLLSTLVIPSDSKKKSNPKWKTVPHHYDLFYLFLLQKNLWQNLDGKEEQGFWPKLKGVTLSKRKAWDHIWEAVLTVWPKYRLLLVSQFV